MYVVHITTDKFEGGKFMNTMLKTLIAVCAVFINLVPRSVNAMATTYVVNTNDDVVDSAGCDYAHCSLREAILAAEQNVGENTILFDGDYVISPIALLPVITEELIIDGSEHSVTLDGSQYLSLHNIICPPQYNGDRSHPGLVFYQADNSKVTGMEIANWCNGITVEETNGGEWTDNLFRGNLGNAQLDFLYSNFNRTIGNVFWQDPIDPTLISGDQVELQHSSSNYFSGNEFTGGENAYEILFESNNNVIEEEVITSCFRGSIELRGTVRGNEIRNNHISNGVRVITEEGAILQGYENGISLDWNSEDNVIEGNVISNVPDSGIAVVSLLGFDSTNDGNIIRNNTISETGLAGILVGSGIRNRMSGNIVSSVGGIGIDLSDQLKVVPGFYNLSASYPDGVTPNDTGLVANNGQNYPVMDEDKSKWNKSLVTLKGSLQGVDVMPDQKFYVECFGNSSMVREAEVFLGSKTVITDAEGMANITIPVHTTDPLGNESNEMYVSCTATDTDGNTSELSEPIILKNSRAVNY
jgi:CSLREA domain-containing protein